MKRLGIHKVMTAFVVITLFLVGGCSVNDPTFVVDTSITAIVEVDEQGSSYNQSAGVNLGDLLSDIEGSIVDINVFNITLQIQRLGATPENLTLNGLLTVDGNTLVSIGDVPISVFANERSILDQSLADNYDFTLDGDGMQYVLSLFENLPSVTVGVSGEGSGSPVNLRFHVKLHAQVTTE